MPMIGIEPTTYGLQNRCSTVEPHRQVNITIIFIQTVMSSKKMQIFYTYEIVSCYNAVMKLRLKVLLSILIFVFLYAIYYWGIPAVVNIQQRTSLIQAAVKKELGIQTEIKNPKLKMGLIPAVWLEASEFNIAEGKYYPFTVKKPKLKLNLLPLLFGKVHLGYFSCDKINADLKIDKKYRIYVGNHMIIRSSNPKISFENSKINIESYNINLKDEIQNKNILIKGDYFNLDKYSSNKQIKFSMNSNIKVNKRYSTINLDVDLKLPLKKGFDTNEIVFDGTVTNLNLEDFSPYIKKFSKNKILQTKGILNIETDTNDLNRKTTQIKTQMAIENLSIVAKNKSKSFYFKNKLNITSIIDTSKNILNIEKLRFLSGRINVDIAGKINKISSRNPDLNLVVNFNKSRIEDLIALIPEKNPPDVNTNITALKKYGYYSDLEGKLFLSGKYDKPYIKGELLSTNGYIIKPLDIPKATVKLKFIGTKVNIDVFVPISASEHISVKGPIDLYKDGKAVLDISSTQNVDLQTAESILNPVHEIFYFDLGPLPVMQLEGTGNIKLKVNGTKNNPHLIGAFNFKNTTGSINDINAHLKNAEGTLYFEDKNTHFVTKKAFLDNKPVKIDGKCSLSGGLDYDITANGQNLDYLTKVLKTSPQLESLKKSISILNRIGGKANITLNLKGKVNSIDEFIIGKTVIASGNVKLLGCNISLSSLDITLKNLFGNIKFKNDCADVDLYSVVDKSTFYIKGKIKGNNLNLKIKLNNLAFSYLDIPVKIFSGNLELNNNKLILYKVNAIFDTMPVLIDGIITNIFKNPEFNIYFNSKPNQDFIEKYVNKNAIYPLKIKGDINYSARIQGVKNNLRAQAEINMEENSSIYYMGATLGDVNDPIRIYLDTNIAKNYIDVKDFQYDKLILSQNNKEFVSPQLNAQGQIHFNDKNINLNNFKVKTQNLTDAKLFNMLFKKPMIKQGLFNSNITINGPINSPKLIGLLNFTGINIPLWETTIKDISLDFTDKNIDIKSKGEIFSNDITFNTNMENRLTSPYIFNNADIHFGNLDINEIAKNISNLEIQTDMNKSSSQRQNTDITDMIIRNGKLKADSVFVKNVFAQKLTSDFSLNEKLVFSADNFNFEISEGKVSGDLKYNLLNSKTSLSLDADKVNANSIAETLFDLPNQIYGSLTGQVDLTCNGKTYKTCMDTLSGKGGFRVTDGKMPKLGSVEYLLKASNLAKSGITGLTLNSVIDMLTPLKTGQFENINGNFSISSGIANSIQIFSRGKDLSIFLTGTYNFSTLIADMEVFGRLSKKITTILGPVGNASLNSLFNTIPGLNLDETNKADFVENLNKIPGFELNDKTYRIFSAQIYGDINGENYVKSFKWIE